MNPDLKEALDLLEYYIHKDQIHTRKGAYVGRQQPLADLAQTDQWRRGKTLLQKYNRKVPPSGTKMDG